MADTTTTATTLGQVADLVRSKNAGPFWQTLDVFFGSSAAYARVVTSGAVTPAAVSALYRVEADSVRIFEMPSINVIKISFPRLVPAGSFADRDMHAGQQHVPLAGLPLPVG
jgi:hypothetical protein